MEGIKLIIRSVLHCLTDDARRRVLAETSRNGALADSKVVADLNGVLDVDETKECGEQLNEIARAKSWLDEVETHVREVIRKKMSGPAPGVGSDVSDVLLRPPGDGWLLASYRERIPNL